MSYISFLDLLGTKDLSLNDKDKYFEVTTIFGRNLQKCIMPECKIYCFSDCAYLESEELKQIIDSLVQLREVLLLKKIFFNAAICEGCLGADEFKGEQSNLKGFLFQNTSVSKVYSLHSMFKGIGILIDEDLVKEINGRNNGNKLIKQYSINNYYIPDIDFISNVQCFYDIMLFETVDSDYDSSDLTTIDKYWEFCMDQYIQSNIKSKRYGRYYLPLLINILSSLPLINDVFSKDERGFYCEYKIIDFLLNLKEKNEYFLNNIVGIEYIYFYLINKIYIDNNYKTSFQTKEFIKCILKLHVIDSFIDNFTHLPNKFFSNESKKCLLEDYCKLVKENIVI